MLAIMTRCYAVLLITVFLLPTKVPSSLNVEVGIQSFLYEGEKHCDNVFGLWKCDPYFVVCISTRNQSCNSNMVRTSTARNKNKLIDLIQNKQISPDPISFKIDSLKEAPFMVRIKVINNNPIHDKLIDVVIWEYNGTTTFNVSGLKLAGENGKARLTLSFLIKCDVHYYGPACNRYCTADHYSRCDQNGIKQCLPGFTGNVCNTSVESANEYQNNIHSIDSNYQRNPRSAATSSRSATFLQSTFQTTKVSAHSVSANPQTAIPPVSRQHTFSPDPRETTEKFNQTDSTTLSILENNTSTKLTSGFQTTGESNGAFSFSSKGTIINTERDKSYTRPTTSLPSSPSGKDAKLVFSTIPPQISSAKPSEPSLSTDTSQSPTSDKSYTNLPTRQQNTKASITMPTQSSISYISTTILNKSTALSLDSSAEPTEPSTQQFRTSKIMSNKTAIPPTNESSNNTSNPIHGKPVGFEHERSAQTSEPRQIQPWIMPLAITLTVVAVTMAIVAAVIFNYFKKKQRLIPYIEMLDNDTEVEIFNGGSLNLQLEPQTSDQLSSQYEELPGETI